MKTCKDCEFWVEQAAQGTQQDNGVVQGECRCNPPIATGCFLPKMNMISSQIEPQLIETTVWPITKSHYWCGKHEPREKPMTLKEASFEAPLRLHPSKVGTSSKGEQ